TADELKSAIKIKKVDILTGSECPDIKEVRRVGKGVEIPLISSEGLEGVLRLGEKVSEDPYDDKDLRLFQTLQVQILSILDRIRPYQKIRKEFEANQKKLYDAEIELERSRRLLSLGTLTAGVTHEIRNPLSVIRSESDRLADKTRDLKYLEEHRDLVAAQVKRIDSIVNRSLGLAKGEKSDKSSINLNDAIEAALQSMVLSSNVKLEKDLKAVPLIQGNADELRQVFDNLIHNAVRAMPDGGLIKLRTYLEDGQVAVQISDDGAGIPKEIQGKIFDPFFSTRHEGAGLGLSIAFQIMQYHGGTIQLESSTVGKGTTFLLSFPSAL
ncbi:MAG: hypothetical protein HQ596_04080, partial [Candidatus Saganbacteria bacterium]|nr:hypothetical protein [Candidatus Saganbacteria bacterium]